MGPPDSETPSSGATEPGAQVEMAGEANSRIEHSGEAASPPAETSNVIAFPSIRDRLRMPREIVEIIEVHHVFGMGFNEFWIAAAGPWKSPPEMIRGGRHPWQRVAVFPHTEAEAAARYAREMATAMDVPIFDLAGIVPDLQPEDGPRAA